MMLRVNRPVDWKVFNTSPVEPVQYYSILKKKRDFSQEIKEYEAQVSKQGYSHYCCIVPKNIDFSLSNKYELLILFFDEILNTSFIGFRVKVSKDTVLLETNLLLLFLKNSNKAICYLMDNNCIHVKCKISDAWELFYCLYDEYLRRYSLTVIGTLFFHSFFCSSFIQKEKQLLEMLYKGYKIVNISKKSVFYKIHRKRKLSVTDLIHTAYNMPKTKRYAMSCFRFKKSRFTLKGHKSYPVTKCKDNSVSDIIQQKDIVECQSTLHSNASFNFGLPDKIFSSSGIFSTFHSESRVLKSESDKSNEPCQMPSQKRKFQEIETDDHETLPTPSSSKVFKSVESDTEKNLADHWIKYCDFKPYIIKSYSDVPCIKKIVPKLLKNEPEQDEFFDALSKNGKGFSQYAASVCENYTKEATLIVKKTYEDKNSEYQDYCRDISIKPLGTEIFKENCTELSKFLPLELHIHQDKNTADSLKHEFRDHISHEKKFGNLDCAGFSTAAGNSISISSTAMLAAQKLVKDVLFSGKKETYDAGDGKMLKSKIFKRYSLKDADGNLNNDNEMLSNTEIPQSFNKSQLNNSSSKQMHALNTTNNFNVEYFKEVGDASFTTATGKNIHVSNTAMLAAQKLLQEVLIESKEQKLNESSKFHASKNGKCEASSAFSNIDCSSKKIGTEDIIDVDMDGTLVEKFFEDIPFDEKELESDECATSKNLNIDFELSHNKNLPVRKLRKSLGGRRSIRYSDKL